jgi:hypothetical protein
VANISPNAVSVTSTPRGYSNTTQTKQLFCGAHLGKLQERYVDESFTIGVRSPGV